MHLPGAAPGGCCQDGRYVGAAGVLGALTPTSQRLARWGPLTPTSQRRARWGPRSRIETTAGRALRGPRRARSWLAGVGSAPLDHRYRLHGAGPAAGPSIAGPKAETGGAVGTASGSVRTPADWTDPKNIAESSRAGWAEMTPFLPMGNVGHLSAK